MTILDKVSEEVAADVLPDEPKTGERSMDFITIITLVISVIQSLVQNCPKPPSEIAASFKRPTNRQRAAAFKSTKENCDCCGMGRFTHRMYRSLESKASALSDVDAKSLVNECQSDQNLLV